MTDLPIILLGAGGHASVVLALLRTTPAKVIGFCDPKYSSGEQWQGLTSIGNELDPEQQGPDRVALANGLGSLPGNNLREQLYDRYQRMGYEFPNLVHPSAILAADLTLAGGVQVMAGAVIQPGVSLGANVIVNTGATIDHDCQVQDHVHIAPGVTLSGSVELGTGAHIGTGANIIQNLSIGPRAVVGAGVTLTRSLDQGHTAYPARPSIEQSRDNL